MTFKHGQSPHKCRTRLYRIWTMMRYRCRNKKNHLYCLRGIKVCKQWEDFIIFARWSMKNGYNDDLQIDRIDNDGNYKPSNCRFVIPRKNAQNRSDFKGGYLNKYGTYCLSIKFHREAIYLGSYSTLEESRKIYFKAADMAEKGIKPTRSNINV